MPKGVGQRGLTVVSRSKRIRLGLWLLLVEGVLSEWLGLRLAECPSSTGWPRATTAAFGTGLAVLLGRSRDGTGTLLLILGLWSHGLIVFLL